MSAALVPGEERTQAQQVIAIKGGRYSSSKSVIQPSHPSHRFLRLQKNFAEGLYETTRPVISESIQMVFNPLSIYFW